MAAASGDRKRESKPKSKELEEQSSKLQADAEQGDPYAQLRVAEVYFLANDDRYKEGFKKAIALFEGPAYKEDTNAQLQLGLIYLRPFLVGMDPKESILKAIECLSKSAMSGDPVAEYHVGRAWEQLDDRDDDNSYTTEIIRWYSRSADKGFNLAQYNLAEIYYSQNEYLKAAELYHRAGPLQGDLEITRRNGIRKCYKGLMKKSLLMPSNKKRIIFIAGAELADEGIQLQFDDLVTRHYQKLIEFLDQEPLEKREKIIAQLDPKKAAEIREHFRSIRQRTIHAATPFSSETANIISKYEMLGPLPVQANKEKNCFENYCNQLEDVLKVNTLPSEKKYVDEILEKIKSIKNDIALGDEPEKDYSIKISELMQYIDEVIRKESAFRKAQAKRGAIFASLPLCQFAKDCNNVVENLPADQKKILDNLKKSAPFQHL